MAELLPTLQADTVKEALTDYLTTTFALTDADAQSALDDFLSHPEQGMFKGPYVRLRLPFRPADEGLAPEMAWTPEYTPYGHQAQAFARLVSSVNGEERRPLPTLVTTGTGSGKTECFLYPILDHVLRAKRQGITGIKALILYPMNALANDQAARLAKLITTNADLSTVSAGIYTGQQQAERSQVSEEGLITDRYAMRANPPDILLTNYKMLDQLLLRTEDQPLWASSAHSLQYLVLDEFHTYDGAQGTDVAMLLRRLGLAIKAHLNPQQEHPIESNVSQSPGGSLPAGFTQEDWARPLGKITPVATSATLGGDDPSKMLEFAETVFGEAFTPDAIVQESRQSVEEWVGTAERWLAQQYLYRPVGEINAAEFAASVRALSDPSSIYALADVVVSHCFDLSDGNEPTDISGDDKQLAMALRAHPLVQQLVQVATNAIHLDDLPAQVLGATFTPSLAATGRDADWAVILNGLIALLGHVRARLGRTEVSTEVHYWLRELTRIDRVANASASFRWFDDGPAAADDATLEARPAFPAVYCRHCGRSGWSVKLAPVGQDLAVDDSTIRRDAVRKEGRVRALIHAPHEAEAARTDGVVIEGLEWFSVKNRQLTGDMPDEHDPDYTSGWLLPILTHSGEDANERSAKDQCPSCGQPDAIRFLGSAIATLLSVSLTTLFGTEGLNDNEKRALVFTDSVQDAAHRAGFVQSRAHSFALRSALYRAVNQEEFTLEELVGECISLANSPNDRFRLVPPDCADRESFQPFWQDGASTSAIRKARQLVRRRLAFDAALEFGLQSHLGRTLELTGALAVEVDTNRPERMATIARTAIEAAGWQPELPALTSMDTPGEGAGSGGQRLHDDAHLVAWVRGVVERIRTRGGINHEWLERYCQEDGPRWLVWGGRKRDQGMPAFPKGRPAPAFPRVGGSKPQGDGLDPVGPAKSWYALWTAKVLGVSAHDAGRLATHLLDQLAKAEILTVATTTSNAKVYGIEPKRILIQSVKEPDLQAGAHLLECSTCKALTPGSNRAVSELAGMPCFAPRCSGQLERRPMNRGFYHRMYSAYAMRRIVAREHTSLLDDQTRLAYENGFKAATASPDAPNVLVATPTLEMGIDIGDLSAVLLSSLPRSVAAYTQRVGRAGRLSGNALALTYVTGRGEHLPKLGDPLSMIAGQVRPPATYLNAEEILRRQFIAYLVDTFARDPQAPHPKRATGAMKHADGESFLGRLIAAGEERSRLVETFIAAFASLSAQSIDMLTQWLTPSAGPSTSPFAAQVLRASQAWNHLVEVLEFRIKEIQALLPELETQAVSPAATEDDRSTLRSAQAALKLARGRLSGLRSEYWIGVLESFGLLPNYTLLDEIATLDVGLSWRNPESGETETDHIEFQRGATTALTEFAPGALFYAHGLQIKVDAVDLGMEAEAVQEWALCAQCGYAHPLDVARGNRAPNLCPRCGDTGIADAGQHIEMVEFEHATAEIKRDEAMISDGSDERVKPFFEVFTLADLDGTGIRASWGEANAGLGLAYYGQCTLRWVNMGKGGHGSRIRLGGIERHAKRFRVCEGCGKLDQDTGLNNAHEHRTWCPYRKQFNEQTRTIALTHTLRTQGIVLYLPKRITLSDWFTIPSLAAALRVGLREHIGGDPDHLSISAIKAPLMHGRGTAEALLIHDTVPGGTGYLTDWATPEQMHDLLSAAWKVVHECPCQHEERLACHRCLLPYVTPSQVPFTSRFTAERHLATLLNLSSEDGKVDQPDMQRWDIRPQLTTQHFTDNESVLEYQFRKVLTDRMTTAGATISETPGPQGNRVTLTLPGTPRRWILEPQVMVEDTKPDFVLRSSDTNVPPVAIYTDGQAFHYSPHDNRVADDARKRENLRNQGYVVLGVTASDVVNAEETKRTPPVLTPEMAGQAMQHPLMMSSARSFTLPGINPVDWLVEWISEPAHHDLRIASRAVALAFQSGATGIVPVGKGEELARVARRALDGLTAPEGPVDKERQVAIWQQGRLAAAVELLGEQLAVGLVLDDTEQAVERGDRDAWSEWLRMSNAMALRDWDTVITTATAVDAQMVSRVQGEGMAASGGVRIELDGAWARIGDLATDDERTVLEALVQAGLGKVPELGVEDNTTGIPLDIAWPDDKVAVLVEPLGADDVSDLVKGGWQVLQANDEGLVAALAAAGIE